VVQAGLHVRIQELTEQQRRNFQAVVFGEDAAHFLAQKLAVAVQTAAGAHRRVAGHIVIVPVADVPVEDNELRTGVNDATDVVLNGGLRNVVRAQQIDPERLDGVGPHHGAVDDGVHARAGVFHLVGITYVHHTAFVRRPSGTGSGAPGDCGLASRAISAMGRTSVSLKV
jgi:hypothetical protein